MVWGLELASNFGPFFPQGDFYGYDEQLETAFNAMTAEEKAYYDNWITSYKLHVSQCFKYEHGTMHGDHRVFRPVAEHEWPKEFRIRRRYKRLGSLIKSVNMLLHVDKTLKDIIEELEPDVHQFRPVKISYTEDEAYPGEYFTMVIGTFLSSFDAEQSTPGTWGTVGRTYHPKFFNKDMMAGLAMKRSVMGTHHLWREKSLEGMLGSPDIFLSDELQKEFKQAGLALPKHFRMKEV